MIGDIIDSARAYALFQDGSEIALRQVPAESDHSFIFERLRRAAGIIFHQARRDLAKVIRYVRIGGQV